MKGFIHIATGSASSFWGRVGLSHITHSENATRVIYAFRGKRFSIPILGLAFRTLHSEIVLGASVDRLVYVIHHCRTVGEVSTVAQAGWLGGNRSSEVVIEANDS